MESIEILCFCCEIFYDSEDSLFWLYSIVYSHLLNRLLLLLYIDVTLIAFMETWTLNLLFSLHMSL